MLKLTRSILLARTSTRQKKTLALQKRLFFIRFSHKILSTLFSSRQQQKQDLEKILIYMRIQFSNSGLPVEYAGSCHVYLHGYCSEPHTHLALIGWGGRSRLCFGGFCIWLLFFCCHGSEAGKWDLWCLKGRMNVLLQKAALATERRTALKWKPGRKTKYSH